MKNLVAKAIISVILALLFPMARLHAQATRQDTLVTRLRQAATGNWYVRVTIDDSTSLEGRIRSVSTQYARVENRRFDLTTVSSIDRRFRLGSGARTGALLGAAGGVFVIGVPLALFGYDTAGSYVGLSVVGSAALGGLLGMTIGEVARPGTDHWRRVWPQ